jgi:CRP-like cAMP-binding protein
VRELVDWTQLFGFFEALKNNEGRKQALRQLKVQHYEPRSVIHNEGDAVDAVYVIMEGSVRMTKGGQIVPPTPLRQPSGSAVDGGFEDVWGVGQSFGEDSVIFGGGRPCTASAVAHSRCAIVSLTGAKFRKLGDDAWRAMKQQTIKERQASFSVSAAKNKTGDASAELLNTKALKTGKCDVCVQRCSNEVVCSD